MRAHFRPVSPSRPLPGPGSVARIRFFGVALCLFGFYSNCTPHRDPGKDSTSSGPEKSTLVQGEPVEGRGFVGSPAHPHEPPGYVPFAQNDGSRLASASGSGAELGTWESHFERGRNPRLTIAEDPTSPGSPPMVVRTKFPTGWRSGSGPVNWGGWDGAGPVNGQKSKLYISYWLKIEGTDYENQQAGTKMGFLGYGQDPEKKTNQGYFWLPNPGRQIARSAFSLAFYQQNHVSRRLPPNRSRRPLITVGSWHHIEFVAEINPPGMRSGVFRMWIDGEQTHDYSDVVYTTPEHPYKFTSWRWNPTWGGRGGVRTRDDYMDIDDVYMSGVP